MEMTKTFVIGYFDGVNSGYVDQEDEPTSNIDNALQFGSKREAEVYKNEIQPEWKSRLLVEEFN